MKQALAAVTGLGAVHAFGRGVDSLWNAALDGSPGCPDGFGRIPRGLLSAVPRFESLEPSLAHRLAHSPALGFGLLAARDAMEEAGWGSSLGEDCGLVLGTTTGHTAYWEESLMAFLKDGGSREEFEKRFPANPLGLLAADLAALLGLEDPMRRLTLASACCASTEAVGLASQWIASGKVKRCLVGGVEMLCELTMSGFRSLQLVSETPCRPFDAERNGINLSEAAAFLCLEAPSSPKAKALVRGYGFSGDASHMTAPHPEGEGCARAMRAALSMAGLEPGEIQWIHAHGTGSRHNDVAEAKAVRSVFGASPPPLTSTKAIHGHALGAAGALEALLACRALGEQVLLPSHGLRTQDPEISAPVQRELTRAPLRHLVKNTLAFGGVNASLVLSGVKG